MSIPRTDDRSSGRAPFYRLIYKDGRLTQYVFFYETPQEKFQRCIEEPLEWIATRNEPVHLYCFDRSRRRAISEKIKRRKGGWVFLSAGEQVFVMSSVPLGGPELSDLRFRALSNIELLSSRSRGSSGGQWRKALRRRSEHTLGTGVPGIVIHEGSESQVARLKQLCKERNLRYEVGPDNRFQVFAPSSSDLDFIKRKLNW